MVQNLRCLRTEIVLFSKKTQPKTQNGFSAAKPCGYYQSQGCNHEVIPANICHPGEGPGDLEYKPYIVQFDIGVHPNIKDKVLNDFRNFNGKKRDCIGCDLPGETCLELIVKGGSDATGGCAGKCGIGCSGAGYAKDCLKHDVCATYKALLQINETPFSTADGFCYDPDCGDEAATTIHNCYIDVSWGFDTPITCDVGNFNNDKAYGWWSYSTNLFNEGPCYNFIEWNNGQGIPNKSKIKNSYEFLAHLESQGVDISSA